MKRIAAAVAVSLFVLMTAPIQANATSFADGSVIIPMDTTYQDMGMLEAYGLLYQLLKADVPVHWVIKAKKAVTDVDVTVAGKDFKTGAAHTAHGYRGGPFMIQASYVAKASTTITNWQKAHPNTTVHVITAPAGVTARTGRLLTVAPTIAVIADDHEDIAFGYLNAAGIPDSKNQTWPTKKQASYAAYPDILTIAELSGPTTTAHNDGALFRASGQPAFCQIMTMHWDVKKVVDEVVAEYRAFLQFPTHFLAECQAVNAIENSKNGFFLTDKGFLIDNAIADAGPFTFDNSDMPYAQMDGTYSLVSGSERAYTLVPGGKFWDSKIVMIKDANSAPGVRTIWMTGYFGGKCSVGEDITTTCTAGVGKVSYLGGHKYEVKLPISSNPKSVGTRLFLNALFEAGCTTAEGQPAVVLDKSGPAWTTGSTVTYTLTYSNYGPGPALDLELADTLPAGASYVSSTGGGVLTGNTVTWKVGDLAASASASVTVTVSFSTHGVYANSFSGSYVVGMNSGSATSNTVTTSYQSAAPADASVTVDAGVFDAGGASDFSTVVDAASSSDAGAADAGGAQDSSTGVDSSTAQDAAVAGDSATAGDSGHGRGQRLGRGQLPGLPLPATAPRPGTSWPRRRADQSRTAAPVRTAGAPGSTPARAAATARWATARPRRCWRCWRCWCCCGGGGGAARAPTESFGRGRSVLLGHRPGLAVPGVHRLHVGHQHQLVPLDGVVRRVHGVRHLHLARVQLDEGLVVGRDAGQPVHHRLEGAIAQRRRRGLGLVGPVDAAALLEAEAGVDVLALGVVEHPDHDLARQVLGQRQVLLIVVERVDGLLDRFLAPEARHLSSPCRCRGPRGSRSRRTASAASASACCPRCRSPASPRCPRAPSPPCPA